MIDNRKNVPDRSARSRLTPWTRLGALLANTLLLVGCSSNDTPPDLVGSAGSATFGGAPGSGGSVTTSDISGKGGKLAAGGASVTISNGGASPAAGGTSPSVGGKMSTAGTGGASGSATIGGKSAGGAALTGGAKASGGTSATGGARTTGGSAANSGGTAAGGKVATGGTQATGGNTTGGVGGQPSVGGAAPVGGSSGATGYRPCPANGDPCKILPLGDSITNGVGSTDLAGYRSQLFKLVVAANQKATFTGSQASGPAQVAGAAFPRNHEGRSGWTIDPGFSSYGAGGISSLVPSPAFSTMPHIVLLMIGTNDVTYTSGQSTMTNRLEGLLDKIILAAPNALIVLAKLTPLSWNPAALTDYNAKLPGIVSARAAKGQHIVLVDMSPMPRTGLATDNVHPNDQGYAFMAGVWYAAIRDLLPQ